MRRSVVNNPLSSVGVGIRGPGGRDLRRRVRVWCGPVVKNAEFRDCSKHSRMRWFISAVLLKSRWMEVLGGGVGRSYGALPSGGADFRLVWMNLRVGDERRVARCYVGL